jgi:hypothetical protein
MRNLREWLGAHRHWKGREQQRHLTMMLRGFYQYFALHHHSRKLSWIRREILRGPGHNTQQLSDLTLVLMGGLKMQNTDQERQMPTGGMEEAAPGREMPTGGMEEAAPGGRMPAGSIEQPGVGTPSGGADAAWAATMVLLATAIPPVLTLFSDNKSPKW